MSPVYTHPTSMMLQIRSASSARLLQVRPISRVSQSYYQPRHRTTVELNRTFSSSSATWQEKKVVVIGGGAAGSKIARGLSSKLPRDHSVTLIEEREYYPHYPGFLRMMVTSEGSLEDQVLIPYDKLFSNGRGKKVTDSVTSITRNSNGVGGTIKTRNSGEYSYDALVLASGTKHKGFLDLPPVKSDALRFINEWRGKFRDARSVAIVGGGAVGCELAGEIRDVYSDTKVTLIHRGDHLLNSVYPEKFRVDVDNRWNRRDITLILGDEIVTSPNSETGILTTRKGARIDADLVISCVGGTPNTSVFEPLGPILTSRKRVKVDRHLQVEGLPGVFAAGDITNVNEVKQIPKTFGYAKTVTQNVSDFLAGKQLNSTYKPMFEVILLSNGSNDGAGYVDLLWGLRIGNGLPTKMKCKTLFIPMARKTLGY